MSLSRAARFYAAPVGKKAIMAVTGMVLFGFVAVHLIGNLQIYIPPDPVTGRYKIDEYGEMLHRLGGILWVARLALLGSAILHIWAAIQLQRQSNAARPIAYQKKDNAHSSYASRTMIWSGPIIGAFIVYHLLHFTGGQLHPDFKFLSVHHNVVAGFKDPVASLCYIAAMAMLGTHLYHGLWSMFQSLGVSHPRYTPAIKLFAKLAAAILVLGNISIPISVMVGLVN